MSIRVMDVRHLRTPEARAAVCYCGRAWAGWPESKFHNPYRPAFHAYPLEKFRQHIEKMRTAGTLDAYLVDLWDACKHGTKPLGCWCIDAVAGDGSEVVCHAQVLAELLRERFCPPPPAGGET